MKLKFFTKANDSLSAEGISKMLQKGGRQFLIKLKQKAIRSNNSWFKILSLEKRRFIDAVIQTVDRIQSSLLLKLVSDLADKLLRAIGGMQAFMGNVRYSMINYGYPLAQKISLIAQNWGNSTARKWATDEGFIMYLSVSEINNLPMYQSSRKIAVMV
jgi:nuclear transport factor 2 (NTF2) superfamily protein